MGTVRTLLAIMIGVSYSLLWTGCKSGEAPQASEVPTPQEASSTPSGPQLELVKLEWRVDGKIGIVDGQVKNLSPSPLINVWVVARFFDRDGAQIASEETSIDSSELESGQTSGFSVLTELEDVDVHDATVEFKTFEGAAIQHIRRE